MAWTICRTLRAVIRRLGPRPGAVGETALVEAPPPEQNRHQRGAQGTGDAPAGVVQVYEDRSSGARASRPGLDRLLAYARRGKFEVVVAWACDRLARSVTHFLQVLDELNHLGVEFVSFREQLDTGGPLGRAMVVIIGAIAELERNLIVERVKAGLRRARDGPYSAFACVTVVPGPSNTADSVATGSRYTRRSAPIHLMLESSTSRQPCSR